MVFFITLLRAVAACIITNSHYTGIYPIELIANGGLIGDILFFAVSGYCLANIKTNFFSWYGKRIWRIYPPVIIITVVYFLIGLYNLQEITLRSLVSWLLYPTNYHFVASIIVLYIPFYFVLKIGWLKKHIPLIMGIVAVIWMVVYWAFYDRDTYHIDNVYEPMIRFLFFESMLLGACFKQVDLKNLQNPKWYYYVGLVICFVLYFFSKLLFSKYETISQYQFLNQIFIFALLFFVFRVFSGLECKLEKIPIWIKKFITLIADMTLEIYVVQYAIIDKLRDFSRFPVNWIVLTGTIFVAAFLLHNICKTIYNITDKIGQIIRKRRKIEK